MLLDDLPPALTPKLLAALPAVLTTEEAAPFWRVSSDGLWKMARENRAPIEPLRLGRSLRWPTALVLKSVGLEMPTRDDADPEAGADSENPHRLANDEGQRGG